MKSWAEKEIEIAIKNERGEDSENETFNYGVACYESAYKAYKCLVEDRHSGMSIGITKNILNRLIEGKPLTPIVDTDDVWSGDITQDDKSLQCTRMSSLFKHIDEKGNVTYSDVSRAIFIDEITNISWSSGEITKLINNMFPISMPYMPLEKPYRVYGTDFALNAEVGCYDTKCYRYLKTPDDEIIALSLYYKEVDNEMVAITAKEYKEREQIYLSNLPINKELDENKLFRKEGGYFSGCAYCSPGEPGKPGDWQGEENNDK